MMNAVETTRRSTRSDATGLKPGVNEISQTQAFRNQNAVEQFKTPLDQQSEHGGGNCALQNRRVVVQVQTAQDWLAQATGADQCGERGGSNVNDRGRFDSTENASRRDRKINFPKTRRGFEPQRNGRFADR